ncbi:acetolactate synthase/ large subunit/ biosynthetic type [Synechococcus sp. PROS-7-1]|uniref:thiamine pyrophosphate-binding protein n=1 Tax=Synechococcus sp. PROS-7-1 TaxID=1442556 RepID=UPI0016483B85|nr:thiamine pyrophosphate-binding protein [Synechococcus sp. PROS-7-1]QNI83944.1 acetolactate synthase/ large subunit/ biosynthetic type [Synechococcus sp. PROS-7-1]
MNLSQHLALFVKNCLNCNTVFTLTGGGAMFLNDAFGNTPGLTCIYNHHEQASAMGALGYSKACGIGVCVTTTGCGATNALTGLLDAWQDSQPVLFISGQVKKKETTYHSGLALRSFGVQELDIIPVVKSLTKQAIYIGSKEEYFDCLAKIPKWLFSGRPGPVWIDIPMDVQSQVLSAEEEALPEPDSVALSFDAGFASLDKEVLDSFIDSLKSSQRPVILVGNGLRLSNGGKGIALLEEYCVTHDIPIVSTYLAADFIDQSCPNYLGVAGLKAARRANIAIYNSDLVIAIGSRLATSVIGFEYEKFAPNAKVYIVDIDSNEHSKKTRSAMVLLQIDAFEFTKLLPSLRTGDSYKDGRLQWLDACLRMKALLPVQEQFSSRGSISIYDVVSQICLNFGEHDFLVSDAGSAYYVSSIMFVKTFSQRYVTSGAQADMGFSLPAAIGVAAWLPSGGRRVHAVTGDGSFQLNLQELQTLITNNLPITLYVLNNRGYLSIRSTQNTFFPGRQCGTDSSTGVDFPNLRLLCAAYGIEYRYAEALDSLESVVLESSNASFPIVCEVKCPEDESIIPRTKTIKKADGTLESAPLCNMQPDLPISVIKQLNALGFEC